MLSRDVFYMRSVERTPAILSSARCDQTQKASLEEGCMGERKRAVPNAHESIKHHTRCNSNAQALVELALILPILMVLIVGALEFGRLWSTKIVLTNAAREGAYYLTTHSDDCTDLGSSITSVPTIDVTRNEVINSGEESTLLEVDFEGSSCEFGAPIKVTTTTTVQNVYVISLLRSLFQLPGTGNSVVVSSSVEMMMQ